MNKSEFEYDIVMKIVKQLSDYMATSDLTEDILEEEKAAYILSSLTVLLSMGISERSLSISDGQKGVKVTLNAVEEMTLKMVKDKFK